MNDLIKKVITTIKEEEVPVGLKTTKKVQKDSKANNDEYLKDSEKRLKDAYSDLTDEEVEDNKFNYRDDEQKEYHDEVEILNGLEMNQFDAEPNKKYQERAKDAIVGSSTMGNNPEWGNVATPEFGGDPEFGKKLVDRIEASKKKRDDSKIGYFGLGDDIELTKDKSRSLSFESVIDSLENKSRNVSISSIFEGEEELNNPINSSIPNLFYPYSQSIIKIISDVNNPTTEANYVEKSNEVISILRNKLGHDPKFEESLPQLYRYIADLAGISDNYKNKTLKEEKITKMKRLKFNKIFNGVENALKLIPENYKIDGKKFQMTDGIETITIKWDGNLFEGSPIVVGAENSKLVAESKNRIKELMTFNSKNSIGIPNKNQRAQEDYLLALNLKKLKESKEETKEIIAETAKPVIEEKFKAQKLDLGNYDGKYVSFKKANYLREDKNIVGVEYHLMLENSSLPKDVLSKEIVENNKNKKPNGKIIKFSFYDSNGNVLDKLNQEIK